MMPYDSLFIDWEVVDNTEAYFSYDMVYDNPKEIVVTVLHELWVEKKHTRFQTQVFSRKTCVWNRYFPLVELKLKW